MIEWNRVTWYSKLLAAILFIVVIPVLAFYIGMQYQKTVDYTKSFEQPEEVEVPITKKPKEFSIVDHEVRADDIRIELSTGKAILIPLDETADIVEVQVVDINFDNYDDVQVMREAGAYNIDTDFYVYNHERARFQDYEKFAVDDDSLVGYADFKPDEKTVQTFWRGRGVGDIFVENTFAWDGSDWHLVQSAAQDMVTRSSDSETDYYVKTVKTYENGRERGERKLYYKRVEDGDSFTFVEVPESEVRE